MSERTQMVQPAAQSRLRWLIPLLVVGLTVIVFSGVTRLEWTNWDDDRYIYENPMVIAGDYAAIFTTPVSGNYNPLAIASHAWEWQQVGDWPWFYHFNNLWMHLVNTLLVYLLMVRLGLQPWWAGFAAVLFGIHPMHVESVAWVTERKDVLYGMFYLGALLVYLQYLETKRLQPLVVCFLLFGLAVMSKIQAVSLPLSMLAIDWYRARKWEGRIIWEKVPFFIGAAVMGYMGTVFLKQIGSLGMNESFNLAEQFVLGCSTFFMYVLKAVVPYETCLLYPYPQEVKLVHVLGMGGTILLILGAIFLRRKARAFTFGLAFFAVNIVFVLQIVDAGNAYRADRFSYIAYVGLLFAVAMGAQGLITAKKVVWPVMAGIAAVMVCVCGWLSMRYIPVWKNSETIWTDVIAKYPRQLVFSYINRGDYHYHQQQKDLGFADFTTAIELEPRFYMGYLRRGDVYFVRKEDANAIADYSRVVAILGFRATDPAVAQALSSRGALYLRNGRYAEALADLNRALELVPQDRATLNSRAFTYFSMEDYARAVVDFSAYLELEPRSAEARGHRGICYVRQGQWAAALADLNAALGDDPQNGSFYRHRAIAHAHLGNHEAAQADARMAVSLGEAVDPDFLGGM